MTVHCHKPGAGLSPVLRQGTAGLLADSGPLLIDWVARHLSLIHI